jgi:hypothetical protein
LSYGVVKQNEEIVKLFPAAIIGGLDRRPKKDLDKQKAGPSLPE